MMIFQFVLGIVLLIGQGQALTRYITVAQDGSGDFKSIQAAINATKDNSPDRQIILINRGIYKEKLVVERSKINISLRGADKYKTIISWDDYSGKPMPGADPVTGPFHNTATSYTVYVRANGFQASKLTIENTAGRVGQALALYVDSETDKIIVQDSRLLGNQDTLCTGAPSTTLSRQYYKNNYIEGTTDFIFGNGVALFERCNLKSLMNSYITAACTPANQTFGYVFKNCDLTANSEATSVYLGRPWRPYAQVVWLDTIMGTHIIPTGWDNWGDSSNEATAYYAEFNSMGVDTSQRVSWSHQLTAEQAKKYTIKNIFTSPTGDVWIPELYK